MANGQHTLTITNLNQNAWYFFDYLEVTSPANSSTRETLLQRPPSNAPEDLWV